MMTKIKEGYKETEIGVIPEDWEVKELQKVARVIAGQSPSSDTYNEHSIGLPFYQGKTEFGYMYPVVKKWCSEPLKIAEPLDVLISVRAPVGDVNICREKSCIGRGLASIRTNNESNHFFLYYMIQHKNKEINKAGQGSTFTAINTKDLNGLKLPIPSLPEQQRIAEILSTTDSHIEKLDKTIEDYQLLKKGMMKKLLTEGIGHTEFKETEIGRIPKEWEVVSLGKIFTLASGDGLSQKDIIEGEYPVYGGNGINGYHNSYLFDKSMITIGRVGAKCGCIHYTVPYSWITDNALYIKTKKKNFNDRFMLYMLEFLNLNQYANQNAQPVISGGKIYPIEIAFPSYSEQLQIGESIQLIDLRISQFSEAREGYNLLKKTLMDKLLTGKIRVNSFQLEA